MAVKDVVRAFSQIAREYDRWYEKNPLFESEVLAIKALGALPSPRLEIGVGSGNFSQALQIDFGLDPSFEMLRLAREKGVKVVCALAEALPWRKGSLGSVLFLFTFCFLARPQKALSEAWNALKPYGNLVLGIINRASPWGAFYQEKAQKGHPLYRYARFFTAKEVCTLAQAQGFALKKAFSTLFVSPSATPTVEKPREGLFKEAGFQVLLFEKEP